jgi:AraC family transcriptional regulator of adaptative response/methylated-DNA-[protein]-cysteine methyltransferase
VDFYRHASDALAAGYRPCKRCHPLEANGEAPGWIRGLLDEIERDPARRLRDGELRARGLDPVRVRRWFQKEHDMTFHAYQRARRLGTALGRIRHGEDLSQAAFGHGFESVSGFRAAFERLFGQAPGNARDARQMYVNRLATPLGPMLVCATDEGICLLEFVDRRMLETQLTRLRSHFDCLVTPGSNGHIEHLDSELARYFAGELEEFEVPLLVRGTPFQLAVWGELVKIPYGETRSYEQIARALDRPGAQRAVGRANGDNRLGILLPCHRVIRADGTLSGYGGGVRRKEYLLALEQGRETESWQAAELG